MKQEDRNRHLLRQSFNVFGIVIVVAAFLYILYLIIWGLQT